MRALLLFAAVLSLAVGCAGKTVDTGDGGSSDAARSTCGYSGTVVAPMNCVRDGTIGCAGGGLGIACPTGDDPANASPGALSCTLAQSSACEDDYCCTPTADSGGPPAGCTPDAALDCSGGADGYACASGVNPEEENPGLSCSTPQADAMTGGDDFCCFTEPSGELSSSTCEPDDDITSVCPDADSYGYQCDGGFDPMTLDPSLACSTDTPDPDGVHDDYCCVYD